MLKSERTTEVYSASWWQAMEEPDEQSDSKVFTVKKEVKKEKRLVRDTHTYHFQLGRVQLCASVRFAWRRGAAA